VRLLQGDAQWEDRQAGMAGRPHQAISLAFASVFAVRNPLDTTLYADIFAIVRYRFSISNPPNGCQAVWWSQPNPGPACRSASHSEFHQRIQL
jgi:hypothetical protein